MANRVQTVKCVDGSTIVCTAPSVASCRLSALFDFAHGRTVLDSEARQSERFRALICLSTWLLTDKSKEWKVLAPKSQTEKAGTVAAAAAAAAAAATAVAAGTPVPAPSVAGSGSSSAAANAASSVKLTIKLAKAYYISRIRVFSNAVDSTFCSDFSIHVVPAPDARCAHRARVLRSFRVRVVDHARVTVVFSQVRRVGPDQPDGRLCQHFWRHAAVRARLQGERHVSSSSVYSDARLER